MKPVTDEAASEAAGHEVVRRGLVSWLTHPPAGEATIEAESRAFHALRVSVPGADPDPDVATPGELLAITHALFTAAFLAAGLAAAGSPADEVVVKASCTFSGPLPSGELAAVDLHVRARVAGIDTTAFNELAETARRQSRRAAGAREDIPGRLETELPPHYG